MRRALLVAFAVLALAPASATAIVAGEPDGNAHPNVGLIALEDDLGLFFCSGTLISPTVVLTAGHCAIGVNSAAVTFDSIAPPPPGEPGSEGRYITGTAQPHTGFPSKNGHGYNDIGVVVLNAAAATVWSGIQPAPLPTANALDVAWAAGTLRAALLTIVGYGAHANQGPRKIEFEPILRRRTEVKVGSLAPEVIKFQANSRNGKDGGSACFGDSGGPAFFGDAVVAVTNGGPPTCTGNNYYQRTDTANARGFLDDYVTVP